MLICRHIQAIKLHTYDLTEQACHKSSNHPSTCILRVVVKYYHVVIIMFWYYICIKNNFFSSIYYKHFRHFSASVILTTSLHNVGLAKPCLIQADPWKKGTCIPTGQCLQTFYLISTCVIIHTKSSPLSWSMLELHCMNGPKDST